MNKELLYVLKSYHDIWEKVETGDLEYNMKNDVLYLRLLNQSSGTKKESFKGAIDKAKELGWDNWHVEVRNLKPVSYNSDINEDEATSPFEISYYFIGPWGAFANPYEIYIICD